MLKKITKILIFVFVVLLLFLLGNKKAFANVEYIGQWGSHGSTDGQFNQPYNVAIDSEGNVYVADTGNDRIQKFTSDGDFVSSFNFPAVSAITIDERDHIYAASGLANIVGEFTTDWDTLNLWGSDHISQPFYIYTDNTHLYLSNNTTGLISQFSMDGTYEETWGSDAGLTNPYGIAKINSGNFYVSSFNDNHISIFSSDHAYLSDEDGFVNPAGLAYDAETNVLYVANAGAANIIRWDLTNDTKTSFGTPGSGDGEFQGPISVAIDGKGHIYVLDLLADKVEYFIDNGIAPTPSSNPSGSGFLPQNQSISCTVPQPQGVPNLFQIKPGKSNATIYFAPINGQNTGYVISYGLTPEANQFATTFNYGFSGGVIPYTINYLFPATWYFKVSGMNNCMPGEWSQVLKIKIS